MSEEIQEAVQIIRVAYDGLEIAMKVGSGGLAAMQKAVEFLSGMLEYEKSIGKTSMRKLLMKGGDLQVLQFNTKDMHQVEKMAKKYGILYSVLPDVNKENGLSEIIFHSEASPRVKMMTEKIRDGKVTSFDDYLLNSDEKGISKLMKFFQRQKKGNGKVNTEEAVKVNEAVDNLIEKVGMFAMDNQDVSVEAVKENFSIADKEAESVLKQLKSLGVLGNRDSKGSYKVLMDKDAFLNRIRGYQNLTERMTAISKSKDMNLVDVTISKQLIVKENGTAVKTRVPGTWGENARYIWVRKENILEIHDGKTMLTFLDKNKEYKLYDEENRLIEMLSGERLYSEHYDKVESSIRKRYEKNKTKERVEPKVATLIVEKGKR